MAAHPVSAGGFGRRVVEYPLSLAARLLVLALLAAALAGSAAWRLRITYDLAYFLPAPGNGAQQLLVERLGQGPGTQIVYVAISDVSDETAAAVARELRTLPSVHRVFPEAEELGPAAIPPALWRNRLLLKELPVDADGWRHALEERLADVALADGQAAFDLIAADPLFASVEVLSRFAAGAPSFEHGTERYLLVHTDAPSFDIGAQTELVAGVRAVLERMGLADAGLYGSGVYGVDLQAAMRREATLFSLLASGVLAALLLWRFRTLVVVAAIGVPMLVGAAAGLCALTFVHSQVHGITLAFGFTLLGVAVDYPLHVFSRCIHRGMVWPTLRIGIASTLVAYGAFVAGGTPGLEQLGIFAIVGVVVAALSTAWIGAAAAAPIHAVRQCAQSAGAPALSHWPWIATLALAAPALLAHPPFSDDLGALTPVPKAILAADAELRERLGAIDMRHLVTVRGSDLQSALVRTERVDEHLDDAVRALELEGHSSAALLLPSRMRQQQRQAAVRAFVASGGALGTESDFARTASDLSFAADAFQPFHDAAIAAAARSDWLSPEDFAADPDLRSLLDAHLYKTDGGWVSLVFLRGLADIGAVVARLEGIKDVEAVDLKAASLSLVAEFRNRLLGVLAGALVVIGAMLWLLTRDGRRSIWLLGTTTAAIAVSSSVGVWLHSNLSLFDLIALALVAGLGLDYGLFHSKAVRNDGDAADTRRAVFICALSSFLVFGILAFSSTPVLHGIGTTVAAGVAAAYLLARFGRYSKPCT